MMKTVFAGLTLSLFLMSSAAFAQTAPTQSAQAQVQTVFAASAQQNTATTAPRKTKIVRQALPGKATAVRKTNKVRVIHTANLNANSRNFYRPTTKTKSTPNFYRD